MPETESNDLPSRTNASKWIFLIAAILISSAVGAIVLLQPDLGPPPVEISKDLFLVSGRTVYLTRCISCHGERGRGDGPLASGLNPPKPRNFVESEWKYGDTAEKALAVVTNGVPGTSMSGWKASYSEAELRAVTAYVFYLAGKPIPESLRLE